MRGPWGAKFGVDGVPLPSVGTVAPVLTVLRMGWSWSFWLVQVMHEHIIARAGFVASRCLVAGWPAPDLAEGPVAIPHCDNLAIVARSRVAADEALDTLMTAFTDAGFQLYDIERATMEGTPLG